MKFRPCIDIHDGVVKQIVGSTLADTDAQISKDNNELVENFVAEKTAAEFATKYKEDNLTGGHIIMLGPNCQEAAISALRAYPGGMQIGGGITLDNAETYLQEGASHVIVTSFVFKDGSIDFERLLKLSNLVGKNRLVIDLSCRRKAEEDDGLFYVVTNKWTKYTDYPVTLENLKHLCQFCSEFLVHGVDVEGKQQGIDPELVDLLGNFASSNKGIAITYAGGVRNIRDLEIVKAKGKGMIDCTIGSALDIFGGDLQYEEVLQWSNSQ